MTDGKVWGLFLDEDITGATASFLMFAVCFPSPFSLEQTLLHWAVWRLIDVAEEGASPGRSAPLLRLEVSVIPLMISFTACEPVCADRRILAEDME